MKKRISTVMAASGAAVALMLTGDLFAAATLTNGGFEVPVIGTGSPVQTFGPDIMSYDESDVPGWQTTDVLNAIELWRNGAQGFTSYEGDQFAEINANSDGILSTTVTPSLGSIIGFGFAHRGRGSDTIADEIRVSIYDLGPGGVVDGDDVLLLSELFADTNVAWGYYLRPLGISTGNTLLLEFAAVSAAGGPTVGNFLDAVGFGERVVPEPATGMLALIAAASACVSRRRKAVQK